MLFPAAISPKHLWNIIKNYFPCVKFSNIEHFNIQPKEAFLSHELDENYFSTTCENCSWAGTVTPERELALHLMENESQREHGRLQGLGAIGQMGAWPSFESKVNGETQIA